MSRFPHPNHCSSTNGKYLIINIYIADGVDIALSEHWFIIGCVLHFRCYIPEYDNHNFLHKKWYGQMDFV